jgi:RNase_R: ribonuclease R
MLPERLCNFICSLRPDEEKLAYSAVFEMTDKGEVKNSRIVHTVIKSDRRFTYEEAQQIIETKEGDFKEEILKLDSLAKILREKRFAAGAINFDRYEVKFEIDEKGKPVSVYFKESKDANKLVEEFMLLANRTVAEKIGRVPKSKSRKYSPIVFTTFRTLRNWITCHSSSPASATSCAPAEPKRMYPSPSTTCWMIFKGRKRRISSKPYLSAPCKKHAIPCTTSGTTDWHSTIIPTSPLPSAAIRT